jgi:tetratricopeptide (TPR) repeat protein
VARGFLALSHSAAFFGEDQEDSIVDLSSYFDARDSSKDYQGAFCELLWAEFLSQDRPLETRYYLAAALAPLLDSLGWGRLRGMSRYLEVSPEAVMKAGNALREAFRAPKKLPNPADIRQMGMSVPVASQMANEYLADPGISEKSKDQFLAQWKKAWGKDAPTYQEDRDAGAFEPNEVMAKLAVAKPGKPEVQYLRGRGLFAAHEYTKAAEALEKANRLAADGHPAARRLQAMAYIRLGRNQEALGCFQALRESASPYWKSQGYRGQALIAEQKQNHSEAASNLWKAERLLPDAENVYLLAEVSLKLKDREDVEKLLEAKAEKSGDHRAHYWLGRYAEEDQQSGVAEDHYRKAWAAAPVAEYAEALSRIYLSREEFGSALEVLEAVRARLSPDGRRVYAECLLQAGRAQDAAEEYAVAFAASPGPDMLARYVEALIKCNRAKEALAAANAFPVQTLPMVRFAVARASLANHDIARARPILEDLAKREDSNSEYHFLLGMVHFESRNYGKAKSEFDEALRYREDYQEAKYYCGLTMIKLGKADGARSLFNELTQQASSDWKAKGLMGMGLAFSSQKKPEAAESFFQRSLGVRETAEAEAELATSRRRFGGPDKWVALAQKAYALDPTDPKAICIMGESMLALGKKAQALALFKRAVETDPNSCDLLNGLAKSQFLTGAYEASKSTSAAAISLCPQEPGGYYYAGVTSEKLQNRAEAESYFKAYRKAGGDENLLPEGFR